MLCTFTAFKSTGPDVLFVNKKKQSFILHIHGSHHLHDHTFLVLQIHLETAKMYNIHTFKIKKGGTKCQRTDYSYETFTFKTWYRTGVKPIGPS